LRKKFLQWLDKIAASFSVRARVDRWHSAPDSVTPHRERISLMFSQNGLSRSSRKFHTIVYAKKAAIEPRACVELKDKENLVEVRGFEPPAPPPEGIRAFSRSCYL
jgi:hypothetical protein